MQAETQSYSQTIVENGAGGEQPTVVDETQNGLPSENVLSKKLLVTDLRMLPFSSVATRGGTIDRETDANRWQRHIH